MAVAEAMRDARTEKVGNCMLRVGIVDCSIEEMGILIEQVWKC